MEEALAWCNCLLRGSGPAAVTWAVDTSAGAVSQLYAIIFAQLGHCSRLVGWACYGASLVVQITRGPLRLAAHAP